MKTRSLGIAFFAAVIVPSTLLAVLSVRAAGREEAFVERQLATALDVETTHAADLANAEVTRLVDELRAGIDLPSTGAYPQVLRQWKAASPLVSVPFLLSPRFGILWPLASGAADAERRFLQENGDFLSDRTATAVLQNIAERYSQEILGKTAPAAEEQALPAPSPSGEEDRAAKAKDAAREEAPARGAAEALAAAGGPGTAPVAADTAAVRQQAVDAFNQSPQIQSEVYQAAAEKGDTLSARVVQPQSKAASAAPSASTPVAEVALTPAPEKEQAPPAPAAAGAPAQAAADDAAATAGSGGGGATGTSSAAASTAAPQALLPQAQPSQYVVTSQLLSQIAASGSAGIIPRFAASGLVFLFWERQADGRIAGCLLDGELFRRRIASVLPGTATASRILTILDENGTPLAAPPTSSVTDWRLPFVSREIGATLPRWESAAYLTRPDLISSQARTTSLVIWIMVAILFVSVTGGGAMVLSSVYGEMRLAQKKSTFVTNVSHELKTPLTSISLFVELLRRKGPLAPEKRDSYLATMASETERLTRLINNVLDFGALSGRRHGRKRYSMQEVDLRAVVSDAAEGQRVRLESRGFAVSLDLPAEECVVRADPEALKQVILNLLSNAEKYSAERHEVALRVERAGTSILLHVLDRGIGVAEKDRERIFREFFRVDDSLSGKVQGTGLGLTIARLIARDHGGDLTCSPREGGGSDFILRLPAPPEGDDR